MSKMEHTKRTIVQHLDAYDIRRKRERLKATTKHFFAGLVLGLILGMIFRVFI